MHTVNSSPLPPLSHPPLLPPPTDGTPPNGTPVKVIYTIHYGVTVAMVILCVIGLALAIVCLLFNIIFKDKK